jgi:hypothetical protein
MLTALHARATNLPTVLALPSSKARRSHARPCRFCSARSQQLRRQRQIGFGLLCGLDDANGHDAAAVEPAGASGAAALRRRVPVCGGGMPADAAEWRIVSEGLQSQRLQRHHAHHAHIPSLHTGRLLRRQSRATLHSPLPRTQHGGGAHLGDDLARRLVEEGEYLDDAAGDVGGVNCYNRGVAEGWVRRRERVGGVGGYTRLESLWGDGRCKRLQ